MQYRNGALVVDYSDEGQGLPVVLIHAFATDRRLWESQVRALRGRYRVIAPSLRGFGDSTPTDGSAVSMDRYADDIVALLDHLGIGCAVVGGISLGGYVALSFALRHPRRLAGLILANTRAGADNPEWASLREALVREIEKRGAVAVVENYGDKPFSLSCPEDVKERARRIMLGQPATGLTSGTLGMAQRPDRVAALSGIRAPTLIISGTQDAFIPSSEGEAMHRAIAGSKLVDIAGAGHLSNIDAPGEFNRIVEDFLQSIARDERP